jgi:hypothetical protein
MREICDGRPCESAAEALPTAVRDVCWRAIEQRQELDDLAQACQALRTELDQADSDDGLAP